MADKELADLTAATTVDGTEIVYIVVNPSGSQLDRKITVANLLAGYQPLDTDLTAIAALSTTSYGRSLLTLANAAALTSGLDVTSLTTLLNGTYQGLDDDLTDLATRWGRATASGPAQLALREDTDNGTNEVVVKAPASIASDKVITLPDATGTVALTPLAEVYYDPASTQVTNSTATMTDIDATNAKIDFTVPADGVVWIEAQFRMRNSASANNVSLGLREGSSDIANSEIVMIAATSTTRLRYLKKFTGLTPGASKTWKLAHSASSGTVETRYGGISGPLIIRALPANFP